MLDTDTDRNPHAGRPFTDDDDAVAAALEDVSVPALLCSMVHVTGDPSWIRSELRPHTAMLNDYQGSMTEEEMAEARRRALPAILEYRDGGCVLPPPPSDALVREMMDFLACGPVADDVVPMFVEDLHLDGADAREIEWGGEVPDEVRADAHVIVIGCGEAGLLAGVRLAQAGLPFTIIEKNGGPGGTWWENRYPGARVDIGSHFYCYSFEPADHWTEYFSQHPELRAYFERVMQAHELEQHCRFDTRVERAAFDDETGRWAVTVTNPDGSTEVLDARFVISAVGSLNAPRMPEIPGMETFAGPSFHSSRWDHDVDHRGHPVRAHRRRGERLPDRADHRRRGRAAHGVPAHRAMDVPEPRTTTAACPTATAGRCAISPSTGAGSASSPSIPGPGCPSSGRASTPTTTTAGARSASRTG